MGKYKQRNDRKRNPTFYYAAKTVKTYQCKCGEDFYEDDTSCVNCGELLQKTKLKDEGIVDVKKEVIS